jgi:hypothetical protein
MEMGRYFMFFLFFSEWVWAVLICSAERERDRTDCCRLTAAAEVHRQQRSVQEKKRRSIRVRRRGWEVAVGWVGGLHSSVARYIPTH